MLPPIKRLDRLNPHNTNSYYDIRTNTTKEIEGSKRWLEVAKEADVMVPIKKATYK